MRSCSSREDVSMTTGIVFSVSSAFSARSTSRPSTLGILRSSSSTAGFPGRPVGVRVAAVQIVERLGAVAHDDDFVREVDLAERRQRQLDVVRVVFRQHDPLQFGHHSACLAFVIDRPARLVHRELSQVWHRFLVIGCQAFSDSVSIRYRRETTF